MPTVIARSRLFARMAYAFAAIGIAGALLFPDQSSAQLAEWTLTKTPNPTTYSAAGQVINYTYVITNNTGGNGFVTSHVDDRVAVINCPPGPNGPPVPANGTLTCTGSYTITAADVVAGSVTNTVLFTGDWCGDGCDTSVAAKATINFVGQPSWTLSKTPGPTTYTGAGQVINYSYVLTNTGNVTINSIAITDNRVAPVSCPASTLAAGANMTCTGSYTTTAADVTASSVVNTATATGTPTAGSLSPATAQATVTFVGQPAWTLSKTPSPTTYTGAGQVINYSYVLTNTGNTTINSIAITDNRIAPVSCPASTLAAGANMTCTGSYTTTAADVTAGSVVNTATATGTPTAGTLAPATAQATINFVGQPSWTLSKTPSPTTYTAAGQAISYSYVLTNTGNVTINSIAITDNRVAPVSCPASTLAAGANMTCTGSYTTTAADVTAGSVVNTATARGTPTAGSLSPATAQATITFRATNGSITIVKTATGGNGAFSFSSTIPGAGSFTLTTANGTATQVFSNVPAGTYTVSEIGLPLRWQLTALTCTGDTGGTPTTVSLATGSATIGLNSGEAITCTFVNTFDLGAHIQQTQDVIRRFLSHRVHLLAQGPDRARFLRRVPGSLWGDDEEILGGPAPSGLISFVGADSLLASRMSFSTSLSQIEQASAAAAVVANVSRRSSTPARRFDVWIEAHLSTFKSDLGGVDNKGDFGILYLGADYLVSQSVLIGALVQFDSLSEKSVVRGSEVKGRGVMAGPYVSARITREMFFDARAAWGLSDNRVNPFGLYEDKFSTNRWLAFAQVTGNWRAADFRVTPSASVTFVEEKQRSYTDTLGVLIPAQTVSLGRLALGPEFARRYLGSNGTIYEPHISIKGVWDFVRADVISVGGLVVGPDELRARLEGGIMVRNTNGWSGRIVTTYDGLFSRQFRDIGVQFWLNIPLN